MFSRVFGKPKVWRWVEWWVWCSAVPCGVDWLILMGAFKQPPTETQLFFGSYAPPNIRNVHDVCPKWFQLFFFWKCYTRASGGSELGFLLFLVS